MCIFCDSKQYCVWLWEPSISTEPGMTVFRSDLGGQQQADDKGRTAHATGASRQFSCMFNKTWLDMHGRAGQ